MVGCGDIGEGEVKVLETRGYEQGQNLKFFVATRMFYPIPILWTAKGGEREGDNDRQATRKFHFSIAMKTGHPLCYKATHFWCSEFQGQIRAPGMSP